MVFELRKPQPLFIVLTGHLGCGVSAVFHRMQERDFPFHFIAPDKKGAHSYIDPYMFAFDDNKLPKHIVNEVENTLLNIGMDVVIATDIQTASWITKQIPYATTILITRESEEEIERNLREFIEDQEKLIQFVDIIKKDFNIIGGFQYIIVNREFHLDDAVERVRAIISGEHHKVKPKITSKPLIFLCHSKEDKLKVRKLHSDLKSDGLNPWLDEVDIMPGKDWELEIVLTIRKSQYFLVCLSQAAINKRGYIQKEIKLALEEYDKMPEGQIFLIPVRLEECEVPLRLSHLQWVDIFKPNGLSQLIKVLRQDE